MFRPLKIAWRKVLSDWKDSAEGTRCTNIQKQHFPPLLKKMMEILAPTVADNLTSGFRKCGIVPLNVEELLNRIPSIENCNVDNIQSAFLQNLEARRSDSTKILKIRRKKLNVPAGKSVCNEIDLEAEITSNGAATSCESVNDHSDSSLQLCLDDNSSDDVDLDQLAKESEEEEQFVQYIEGKVSKKGKFSNVIRKIGEYVAFVYEGEIFPGEIVAFNEEQVIINAMKRSLKAWKWPQKHDEMTYRWEGVLGSIKPPIQISKRGFFNIPELTTPY